MERLPSLAETKFQDVLLAFAVAQLFPGVKSNSLEPGWVPTWAAPARPTTLTRRTGRRSGWRLATNRPRRFPADTFFHQKLRDPGPSTKDVERQSQLLDLCHKVSGTALHKS